MGLSDAFAVAILMGCVGLSVALLLHDDCECHAVKPPGRPVAAPAIVADTSLTLAKGCCS